MGAAQALYEKYDNLAAPWMTLAGYFNSIRERIYCLAPGEEHGPMAGILLYTAASDSEGTLGGLVQLTSLGRQIHQALEALKICGSDPLCSEHPPTGDGRGIHGASCHACLFAPETPCEKGNRYLDRNTLFETFAARTAASELSV